MSGPLVEWGIVIAAPVIWFVSMLAGFAVAPLTCPRQPNGLLLLISVIAFLLVACACFVGRLRWKRSGGWIAILGTILSAGFLLVIVAQAIPSLMLQGCQ